MSSLPWNCSLSTKDIDQQHVRSHVAKTYPRQLILNTFSRAPTLVTGANGWLGRHIIRENIRSHSPCIAMIRSGTEKEYLQKHISPHFSQKEIEESELYIWVNPDQALYNGELFALIHCASNTSMIQQWPHSMTEHLHLIDWGVQQAQLSTCVLDYISTLSVFVSSDYPSDYLCQENIDLMKLKKIYGYYAIQKWAMEKHLSAQLSIQQRIHRLGLLHDSETEVCPHSLLKDAHDGLLRFSHPQFDDSIIDSLFFDVSPTDQCVSAILKNNQDSFGVYHYCAQQSTKASELIQQYQNRKNTALPQNKVEQYAYRRMKRSLGRALYEKPPFHPWWADLFQMSGRRIQQQRSGPFW